MRWFERDMLHEQDCRGDNRQASQREGAPPHVFSLNSLGLPRRACLQQQPKHPHWLGDVFDPLCAEVLIVQRQLFVDVFVDGARYANAAGVGETLQPRRDVDPVTVDLIALDHHVAEVDADAELHPALRRQLRVLSFERGLNIHRAIHRLDDAGELG
jgi:hypothetical protein